MAGYPQGRGKIDSLFGLVRQEFLVEIGDGSGIAGLAELNRLFTAWCERVSLFNQLCEQGPNIPV